MARTCRCPNAAGCSGPLLDALPVPVDLLVYTPQEFAAGKARDTGLFYTLAEEGVTIHERDAQ